MKLSASEAGVILLVAAEVPQAFASALPSIMTVRTFVDDDDAVHDIREGEVVGAAISLVIAGAAAKITGSAYPILVAFIMIGIMVGVYEYALAGRRGNYNMAAGTSSAPSPQATTNV
jgi:hypothetical protein